MTNAQRSILTDALTSVEVVLRYAGLTDPDDRAHLQRAGEECGRLGVARFCA